MIATDRGDIRELTDGAGVPFPRYDHDAYGNPTRTLTAATSTLDAATAAAIAERNVLCYAGCAFDGHSGLYYLSQRYYDPATSQFITKDPAKADGEESAYQYCGGDPVGKVDPSGEHSSRFGSHTHLGGYRDNSWWTGWRNTSQTRFSVVARYMTSRSGPTPTPLFAFKKSGYHAISPTEFSVGLGEERTASVVMRPATTASLTGRVVDRKGKGVEGATVRILDYKDEQVAAPAVGSEGVFSIADLPVKPSGNYAIAATGDGVTVTEPVSLTGGEVTSVIVKLIPGRGELAERVATEGYTSWMIKAGWPGFMDVGGQSIYVWYGNYAIRLGAQYWDGSRELNRVDVTAWGGKYETHCTKGEIEFKVTGDDLTGKSGKKLPPPMGQATDAVSQSWWKSTAKKGYELYEKHKDAINLGKEILTGVKKVKEAWDDQDQWIILGQGPELLTWKMALEDFATRPSWDSDHPLDSVKSFIKAIPKSFAIPIVIGGSSVQETAVRVDGIDVVDKETGEVHRSDRAQWYSYDDLTGDGTAFKSYEIEQSGVSAEDVRILVWIRVQKYWQGRPGGTCFSEREQQVIVFDPGTGGMKAFIAPGDLYKNPDRWTTDYISRLAP